MHRGGRRFDPDTLHFKAPIIGAFFMHYTVYIIYSEKLDKHYTGSCENFAIRL
jgi:hypothetical protein